MTAERAIPAAETIVGTYWPLHGPYDDERTHAAGSVLSELVRYLNYATGQGSATALPYASTANGLVSHLSAAVAGLDQTLRQLEARVGQFRTNPLLYDDRHSDLPEEATRSALGAEYWLREARRALSALHFALNAASSDLGHLGHREG